MTFGFQVARVEGQSMAPTLEDQDRLIVNKAVYRISEPRRGDSDVGPDDRGTDDVREQSATFEAHHALRPPVVALIEVAQAPRRQAEEGLGAAAADIVLWPAAMREPFERELIAVPRAADNRIALVLANRLDSPYPGGSMVVPPTGFPLLDINQVVPRSLAMGAVMPMFIDLAVCRQKQMIPKVDMFANRLTRTYAALVESSPRAEAAE